MEFDSYVFRTLATAASAHGNISTTALIGIGANATLGAYEAFLNGMEALGNANVPDQGRVAFCSYRFANLLKQDPAFMKYGDKSQEMLIKGVIGEVDGCKIVKVPSSRLPAGCAFLLTHPVAATAPKQLEEYKIHDNPPGVSGWLVEGRFIYDCFVLNNKADAVYYHGSQPIFKRLEVMTAPGATGNTQIIVPAALEGNKRYYKLYANQAAMDADTLTYGTPISTSGTGAYTEMKTSSGNPQNSVNLMNDVTASTNTLVRVVEVDASSNPLAVGTAIVNKG